MPVIIDGTNGISGVDGSASTPAVQGTDTNTGMFFPAADTIAFAEGGTEVMRIDSSGNLRVGSSSTALNSINSTNTFGFKNRIINGAMGIWQRGTSFSASGGNFYTADRWQTLSQQGTYARSTDVPSGFQYSLSITSTSSFYGTIAQRIESANAVDLAGQTVTISFWAKATTGGASGLGVSLDYANAVDNFSSTTYFGGGSTAALTSTWTRYSVTITNLNANVVNGLQLYIYNLAGGAAAITYLITGIQLEKGSTATSFDYRPYGAEFILCQRYYQTIPNIWANAISGCLGTMNINDVVTRINFYPPMRTTPTIVTFSENGTSGRISVNRNAAGFAANQLGADPTGVTLLNGSGSNFTTVSNVTFGWTANAEL